MANVVVGVGALAAWIVLGAWPARAAWRDGGRRTVAWWLAAVLLLVPAATTLAAWLPVPWITPLREGLSAEAARHALGEGLRPDIASGAIAHLSFHLGLGWSIRSVLALDLWCQLAGAVTLAVATHRAGAPAPAAAAVAAPWCLPPLGWHVATSGTTGPQLLWLVATMVWAWIEAERQDRPPGWFALPAGIAAVLALGLCTEASLWGVWLLGAATVLRMPGGRAIEEGLVRFLDAHRPFGAIALAGTLLLGLGAVRATAPAASGLPLGSPAWIHAALGGSSAPLTDLIAGLAAAVPPATLILVGLALPAIRHRPVLPVAVALLTLTVWQAQLLAAHGNPALPERAPFATWEAWRYLMRWLPVLWLGVVVGACQLPRWAAWIALPLTVVPPQAGWLDRIGPHVPDVDWPSRFGIQGDRVTEVRGWIEQLPARRGAWITRALPWGLGHHGPPRWFVVSWLGDRPISEWVDAPPDTPPEVVLDDWLKDHPDLSATPRTAWMSVDCVGHHDPGCRALSGLPPVGDRVTVDGLRALHPDHAPAPRQGPIGARHLRVLP